MANRDVFQKLYEYHKLGYENYFIPTKVLVVMAIVCFGAVIIQNIYVSPVLILLFFSTAYIYKREAHREGWVDGVTEASSLYENIMEPGLLDSPDFIEEISKTIEKFKSDKK